MGRQPNVLVVMSDQQKAVASHLYGSEFGLTPSMERLAASGTIYDVACTPHPLCVPARCAFWSSQYAHTTGCRRNETLMPPGAPHAMKLWKEQGFRLGLIGKNHCFETAEDLAMFDTLLELGHGGASGAEWGRPAEAIAEASRVRRELVDQNPRFGFATTDAPLEDQTTGLVTNASIRFLEEHAADHSDEPFVLWTSYPDPHEPWVCPEKYAAMFRDKVRLPPSREGEFDEHAPQRNRVLHAMLGARKTPFLSNTRHFILNTIILPRQARDTHRKRRRKKRIFHRVGTGPHRGCVGAACVLLRHDALR
jgi:arylsulfatase A-like enzyme